MAVRIMVFSARNDEGCESLTDVFELPEQFGREEWSHWWSVARARTPEIIRARVYCERDDKPWKRPTDRQIKIHHARSLVERIAELKIQLREELDMEIC